MSICVSSRFPPSESLRYLSKGAVYFAGIALLVLGAAIAPIASAQVAEDGADIDATGNPKSEMAACNSGETPQSRQTCINEVRRAQAAKRAGKLQNYGDFAANALKRCDVFKDPDDLAACQARVKQTDVEGSVAEGGILRKAQIVETPEPTTVPEAPAVPEAPVVAPPASQ
jgi:hypothetical protein